MTLDLRRFTLVSLLVLLTLAPACIQKEKATKGTPEILKIQIKSPAFENGRAIPKKYTCDGADVSPALTFVGVPSQAKSLAIIMDDPDAPFGVFDHWVVWNIPPETPGLKEGARLGVQGKNDFSVLGYRGPCPPPGKPHRYMFRVYALNTLLNLPEGSSKEELEKGMENHVLAVGELMGTYHR